jgi:MFS family permease
VIDRLRILQPLRERDFALFWTGWTVSLIGDGFFLVAIAWQAFDLWNSPTALALVGVAETIPLVAFLLIGGVVSDRFERRRVLIASSALRGACVAVLASSPCRAASSCGTCSRSRPCLARVKRSRGRLPAPSSPTSSRATCSSRPTRSPMP